MKKRLLKLVLVLCMLSAMVVVPVSAARSGICGDNLTWSLDDHTLVINGTGKMYDYEADEAPWCENTEGVGTYRAIEKVVIENGVTSIGNFAFASLDLFEFYIPDTVTSIGSYAFNGTDISSVSISRNISYIGICAFSGCKKLNAIYVDEENPYYSNDEYGVLFDKNKTKLICYPNTREGAYVIPYGVNTICQDAFYLCKGLNAVSIPESVTKIELCAFDCCENLTEVVIPDSVTSEIDIFTFHSCKNLKRISIGVGITKINRYAFSGCDNVEEIKYTGDSSQWNKIKILEENDCFKNVPITFNSVPNTTVPKSEDTPLKTSGIYTYYVLSAAMSNIYRESALIISIKDSGDTVLDIPAEIDGYPVTHIEASVFTDLNYTEICLPETINRISVSKLSDRDYNDTYTAGDYLRGNSCLKKINVSSSNKEYSSVDGVLFNKDCTKLYCYPKGKTDESYTVPYGVNIIGSDAFNGNTYLKKVIMPETVTSIYDSAFAYCSNLQNVVCNEGLEKIQGRVFRFCENLEKLTLPMSLKTIETANYALYGCNKLKDVYYAGSKAQWQKVNNGPGYEKKLNGATIHYGIISILLDDEYLELDQPPVIVNGRTLVPLRAIFEALGATVEWDGSTQTVTSTLKGTTLKLTIGSNVLYKNGTPITLDVPAQLINNRTMVPVRAVSEAFGANVKWDGDTRTVYISTQGKINAFIVNADAELTDNDAALMRETLLNNKLLPIDEQNFHIAFEPTRDYFNRIIDVLIQQAAENDITYFYYSGHGGSDGSISPTYNHETRNGSFSLTPNELAEILNKIPGTVVVILDSCYSGTITNCNLDTDKFKILTASGNGEFSNASNLEAFIPFTDERLGEFTEVLLNGLGGLEGNNIIYNTITGRDGKVKADYDKNRQVTLSELFRYVTENISANQHPCVSDENDQTVIYAY